MTSVTFIKCDSAVVFIALLTFTYSSRSNLMEPLSTLFQCIIALPPKKGGENCNKNVVCYVVSTLQSWRPSLQISMPACKWFMI